MPKASMIKEDSILEGQIIDTLLAGLKQYRSDLSYPESHSDMQGCVRALLVTFEVKRRPLPAPLKYVCHSCEGIGHLVKKVEGSYRELETCKECQGKGHRLGQ